MSDVDGGIAVGVMLNSNNDLAARDRWARLRFAIIGPLLVAPTAPGDLQTALREMAAKPRRHPFTGLEVSLRLLNAGALVLAPLSAIPELRSFGIVMALAGVSDRWVRISSSDDFADVQVGSTH